MSNSPRETQNQDGPGDASSGARSAQGSQSQEVQGESSILAEVLAEARQVLSQEGSAAQEPHTPEQGPIRQSAQSVKAIPTFLEPEPAPRKPVVTPDPRADATQEDSIPARVIHEPAPFDPTPPEEPIFEELGLCTEERRQLIEPMDDFTGYDPETGREWSRGAPRALNILAIPRWCGPWQRRFLNAAAILLACGAPVAWAVVMTMPPVEAPRTATAGLQLEALPGPLSLGDIDPINE